MRRIILIFSALLASVFECHRVTGQEVSSVEDQGRDQILVQEILAGDRDAIELAGKSGNLLFVPYLKQELETRATKGEGFKHHWPEELALARLGQVQQLQEFWCSAIVDDPKHGLTPSVKEFEWIGGWFSIQALQKFLKPEGLIHWHKPTRQEKESDTGDLPVQVRAMITLSKLVPNPPVPPAPIEELRAQTQTQKYIQIWQDWLEAHKEELSKLQPTGEGVDFSPNARKNGKPRKKH